MGRPDQYADAVASTEAGLRQRGTRPPDFERENRALLTLAAALADRPEAVLQTLCETAVELCEAGSAGISLSVPDEPAAGFFWPVVAGAWASYAGQGVAQDASPCHLVLETDRVLLFDAPQARFPAFAEARPAIVEALSAPIHWRGRPIGTIWILSHDPARRFDLEDRRRLTGLATFASAAYAATRSDGQAKEARDRLSLTLSNAQIVGLWDWDVQRDLVVADQRFADLFGVDRMAAAAGTSIAMFVNGIHPDDRERVSAEIGQALRTGAPFISEYRLGDRDGEVRHVLARGERQVGPDGLVLRFPGVVVDITDQRRAETARDQARDRYETLFNSTGAGFCIIEMLFDGEGRACDYRFLELNPAFQRQTGLTDAAGKTIRALAPAHEDHWFEIYGRVATTGQPEHFESRAAALDDRWFDVHAHRVGAPADRQVAVLFTDITERRQMELALRASEQEFRTLAEAVPGHVWTAQAGGALDWFNDRVYAYTGKPRGSLHNGAWAAMVHPDDLPEAVRRWSAAVKSGANYETEFRLRRHDGRYRWHIGRAVPVRDGQGTILRWIGANTDIQDQKETAETLVDLTASLEHRVEDQSRALRESQDFTRLALSAVSGVGVWTYDVAGDRYVCDRAIAELYGLDPAAGEAGLVSADFLANIHPDDRASLAAIMAEGRVRPGDLEAEYRLVHADGSIHWVLSRGHTYFEDGRAVRRTGVGVETTHLRQLEEQLRQSQKMEAVGQLTGGIAHDFNNMLTGISGSLELIKLRLAAGRTDGVERFMEAAATSAKRAAGLTHRLLAFARRQPLDTRSHDIARLIRGMEEMLHRTLGEHVHLETHLADTLWAGLTDANQFENALLNLAINARDAMPDGGKLTIEAANVRLDERYAAGKSEVLAGDYVAVAVSDSGVGMSAEVLAKAFDPFFTTKPIGQGTGLGLSMIYGFVKQTGGHIRIYSQPDQGTTVTLYLPRAQESDVAPSRFGAVATPRGAGETILVVEDDPAVRLLITEVLRELGYAYLEAEDARAALEIANSDQAIDLLISDVGLPVMNGRQLAEIVRERRPGLKVLFVSGYAENALLRSHFLAPGMEMMTKPFALDALARKVRALIEAEID